MIEVWTPPKNLPYVIQYNCFMYSNRSIKKTADIKILLLKEYLTKPKEAKGSKNTAFLEAYEKVVDQ